MDINTKELKKNAFRVTKVRGVTSSRVRVPGGLLKAEYLGKIQEIAEKYGNGTVNLTARQGFEIPGIPFEKIPEVNQALQEIIDGTGVNQTGKARGEGYPASGTRNVSACVGNRVCPYACYDTTALAQKIEKVIFPNDLHVKIVLTGCPNDCQKVRMGDIGIMGMTEPQLDPERCVSCGACIKACRSKSVDALTKVHFRPERDTYKCIGCGDCADACPSGAISMVPKEYPAQQPKTDKVCGALRAMADHKATAEKAALQVAEAFDKDGLTRLMTAIARSERLMEEDLLREAGFMLPQSDNAHNVLEELASDPPAEGFPTETVKELLTKI